MPELINELLHKPHRFDVYQACELLEIYLDSSQELMIEYKLTTDYAEQGAVAFFFSAKGATLIIKKIDNSVGGIYRDAWTQAIWHLSRRTRCLDEIILACYRPIKHDAPTLTQVSLLNQPNLPSTLTSLVLGGVIQMELIDWCNKIKHRKMSAILSEVYLNTPCDVRCL